MDLLNSCISRLRLPPFLLAFHLPFCIFPLASSTTPVFYSTWIVESANTVQTLRHFVSDFGVHLLTLLAFLNTKQTIFLATLQRISIPCSMQIQCIEHQQKISSLYFSGYCPDWVLVFQVWSSQQQLIDKAEILVKGAVQLRHTIFWPVQLTLRWTAGLRQRLERFATICCGIFVFIIKSHQRRLE